MRVAVVSCTRDRIGYTQHCFARLRDLAGCGYDHFVLDQGSQDGTVEWLYSQEARVHAVIEMPSNVGIWRGFNMLISEARRGGDYDVFVTFDNDCEPLTDGVLREVCELALANDACLSPRILGLKNPPPTLSFDGEIEWKAVIGNIFMAIPAWVVDERRFDWGYGPFDETRPAYGGDEVPLAEWMRSRGSGVGYLVAHEANHYLTSAGQEADDPVYFDRKRREMAEAA